MVHKVTKTHIFLFCILFFSFFLRLLWIDKVPNTVTGDELTYIITAKSVQLSGTNMHNTWSIWKGLLFQYPEGERQAELPYFLLLPFVGISGNSLFWIRFPYALMTTCIVLFTYLITKRLFGVRAGLVAGIFASINPWFFSIGRTAYEMTPATLFYLISLFFILDTHKKRIYIAIPFLILAFYSYIATKLLFLPFIVLGVSYAFLSSKERKISLPHISLILTGIGFVGFFLITQFQTNGSRMNELFLPNDMSIQQTVDSTRKATIQNPLLGVLVNKGTIYIWTLIGKTFAAISPSYLFFEGDLFFSLWHGFLYPIDMIFIVFGLISLVTKKKYTGIFFLLLLAMSLLPQILHKTLDNFSPHITLFIPLLIIISAYGLTECMNLIQKKVFQYAFLLVFFCVYGIFFVNFLHTYFFRSQLEGRTGFDMRVLSHYVLLARTKDSELVVISSSPSDLFRKYLFYTDSLQKNTIHTLQKNTQSKNYSFNNVTFLPCESHVPLSENPFTLVIDSDCKEIANTNPYINISRLNDGGSKYKIYNDKICSQFELKSFPFGITIGDFAVESMPVSQFCQTFITKFN